MRRNLMAYEIGDTRVIRKFLFFPLKLNYDWRWLEYANIKQEFVWYDAYYDRHPVWENVKFVDK